MNKLFKLSALTIILSLVLYACSKDDLNTKKFNLIEQVTLTETTSNVSDLFLNMGVIGINITNDSKSTLYEFKTKKTFIFNGNSIDLSNYSILLEDEMISLNSNSSLKLTLLDNQPYIIYPGYSGLLNITSDDFKNVDLNILLLFMKEMITTNDMKINTVSLLNGELSQQEGCSFWNTYYVVASGGSRSVAETNLEYKDDDDVVGCRELGAPDSTCVWGDHFCVASQAYCCD